MVAPKFILLVLKYILRHRTRSFLTIGGVATSMFLFYAVQAMQEGIRQTTEKKAEDTTLIVYREDRFCPFTSRLPEDYARKISLIEGVKSVIPMKIFVNNCRANLDVVTFRGVPQEVFDTGALKHLQMIEGSIEAWKRREDAALIGERMANRRRLKVGDRFVIGGIAITISGIFRSDQPQDQNVAYTHLKFTQRSSGHKEGSVTQFNVIVKQPEQVDMVAEAIDKEFKFASDPTSTWSEKAFVARAIADIIEIVQFARWLGLGALVAVFALVANAIILAVQDRIKDHAVFQTLGFNSGLIARLIILESFLLSILGGSLGLSIAMALTFWSQLSFSVEGLNIPIQAGASTILIGMGLCSLIGILAGLFPAWQASRREIVACFRAV